MDLIYQIQVKRFKKVQRMISLDDTKRTVRKVKRKSKRKKIESEVFTPARQHGDWFADICVFDVETTGTKAQHKDDIFSYCIGWPVYGNSGEVVDVYVEVRRVDNEDGEKNKNNWIYLQKLFLDATITKIAHNFKFELHFLHRHGIEIAENTIWHDTMLMSQCLRNLAPSHALDFLCWELCGYSRELDEAVKKEFKALGSYQLINHDLMDQYQRADGERPFLLFFTFSKFLKDEPARYNDYLVEIENTKSTQKEESFGIQLDFRNMQRLELWLYGELEKVRDESFEILSEYINLNSDDQVRRILYEKLQLPILGYTKGAQAKPSTDKDILLTLRAQFNHPIIDLILRQRSYSKALSTLKSYYKHARSGDVIFPHFNQNMRTSRKSSSDPNLQNVSKDAALKNPYPVAMRKCFRCRKGYVLLPVDYSGIEMRLIIAHSGESELIEMLQKDRFADLHHCTLECFLMPGVFGTRRDQVFREGRRLAIELKESDKKLYKVQRGGYKNTGFCIAYGGSTQKVAVVLSKTVDEIRRGDANYRRRFPKISGLTQSIIEEVNRNGFIITPFGRKLYVPKDKPYIGANYKIQGTAAGVLKRAQNRIGKLLEKPMYREIKMILDVHDELIFEYPRILLNRKDEILPEFSRIMVDMPEIPVPLGVEWNISTTNWNDKKELEVSY